MADKENFLGLGGLGWNVIGGGLGALGSLFGGGGGEGKEGTVNLALPEQKALLVRMLRQLGLGAGEFGFGNAARQGTATLRDMMARNGMGADSGAFQAANSNMLANAASQDNARRWQTMLAAAQASPAMFSGNPGESWARDFSSMSVPSLRGRNQAAGSRLSRIFPAWGR